jgi:hypothetical protein
MPGAGAGMFINFAWAVGGIIIGYIGGMVINKPDGNHLRVVGGLIILVIVALGAVLNYENSVALNASVACQRKFNVEYRGALQAQLDAHHIESQAQRVFIEAFRRADVPPDARGQLFDTYLQRLDAAERLRNAHPLPVDNPCGGPGA